MHLHAEQATPQHATVHMPVPIGPATLGTSVFVNDGKTRRVAALDSQTPAALQLWSQLLLSVQSERIEVYKGIRRELELQLKNNPLHDKVCESLGQLLREVYEFQFALCEESQIMSKHIQDATDATTTAPHAASSDQFGFAAFRRHRPNMVLWPDSDTLSPLLRPPRCRNIPPHQCRLERRPG